MRLREFNKKLRRRPTREQVGGPADALPPAEPQQQSQPVIPQGAARALGALQTLGRTYNTFKDKDLGAIVKQDMIDLIKNKARNEPNR